MPHESFAGAQTHMFEAERFRRDANALYRLGRCTEAVPALRNVALHHLLALACARGVALPYEANPSTSLCTLIKDDPDGGLDEVMAAARTFDVLSVPADPSVGDRSPTETRWNTGSYVDAEAACATITAWVAAQMPEEIALRTNVEEIRVRSRPAHPN